MAQSPALSASVWAGGRTVGDPGLSPDGSVVAFVAGYLHGAELVLVPASGGVEQWLPCEPAITAVPTSGGGVFDWLPDGSGIVYLGVDGRLHRLDLATSGCHALTRSPDDPSAITVSPRGDQVAYVIDTRHVVVVSTAPAGGWPRRISDDVDFALDPAWSPNGTWIAWHEWDEPEMPWYSSRIVVRRADGSGAARVVDGGDGVAVGQPRFSPDGRLLSYLCDRSGWMNLWAADVAKLEAGVAPPARPLVEEPSEHGTPAWGPGQRTYAWDSESGTLVHWRNDHGWGRLAARTSAGDARELSPHSFTGLRARAGKVVGVAASATLPLSVQVVELSGRTTTVARGAVAGVERAGVEPEKVRWESEDGTPVPGRLYRTPVDAGGAPPLLVWLHEGPTGQSLVRLDGRLAYFLQRGWSVLVPDYRGSAGWGRSFMESLNGRWGEADVADVAAGIRAAAALGWGDPTRVVPYGGSAGGFLVLLLLARHPELCAAGVALYPVADLLDFRTPPWRYQAHYLEKLLGSLPRHHGVFAERSPLVRAADIAAPLLVLHGDGDTIVPTAHSDALVDTVRRAGGTVEHHVYQGEGHGWTLGASVADELERVESFLRRHVLHLRSLRGPSPD